MGSVQGKCFLGGTLMAGSDPIDRFLQECRLRTEHLGQAKKQDNFSHISAILRRGKKPFFSKEELFLFGKC